MTRLWELDDDDDYDAAIMDITSARDKVEAILRESRFVTNTFPALLLRGRGSHRVPAGRPERRMEAGDGIPA